MRENVLTNILPYHWVNTQLPLDIFFARPKLTMIGLWLACGKFCTIKFVEQSLGDRDACTRSALLVRAHAVRHSYSIGCRQSQHLPVRILLMYRTNEL